MRKIVVSVKPNSKEESIEETKTGYRVCVKTPPTEGKANKDVIKVVAKYFNVPKSNISIEKGHNTRHKILSVVSRSE